MSDASAGDQSQERRQREELTSLVVHDLKNPLTSILANASFLLDEPDLPETAREAVADIMTSAETLHRMVLELLDIALGEDVGLAPRPEETDAARLVEEVIHRMRRRAAERGQRVELEARGAAMTRVDPELLRRMAENLVERALQVGPAGSLVRVAVLAGDGVLELRVEDQGEAIPLEWHEKIFDKYARLARPRAPFLGGRGLGLVFCRLAAEAHGGRIWIEPGAPRGNRFHVRLPSLPPGP